MDTHERITAILEARRMAVFLIDAHGAVIGKSGQLSGVLGALIPSKDKLEARRWRFPDSTGSLIAPPGWPGARALRGEVDHAGLTGSYLNDGEHPMHVICVPIVASPGGPAAMTFIRAVEHEATDDLEERLIHTLAQTMSAATRQ